MGNLFDELKRIYPDAEPRTCRKIGYVTRADAEAHLARVLHSPDCKDPESLYIYRCANCGQLHVGHETREPVRDENGLVVAPPQPSHQTRPAGPWDSNAKKE